ncbi:hypothetical protein D5S17_29965 [Pseudonocardiaceae bacterium YIM PH 21723]|nr:hypothetical protein D5S17_29965 [Pseudonocardiaceae bacterium YIM PH 21723]
MKTVQPLMKEYVMKKIVAALGAAAALTVLSAGTADASPAAGVPVQILGPNTLGLPLGNAGLPLPAELIHAVPGGALGNGGLDLGGVLQGLGRPII